MTKQRVLITGASTGIGRACAIRIARRGFTVFAGVRSSVDAERLRAEVTGDLRPVQLDVTRSIEIEAMLAEMGGQPLAGLVNNAGIAIAGPLELIPMDAWRRQIEVNLLGLVAVTQACLPALRSGRGRIVNIGSIAGRLALPGSSAYDASKFAIEGLSDALRMELRSFGVSVSLIEPGAIATPIWKKSLAEADSLLEQADPIIRAPYAPLMAKLRQEAEISARHAVPPDTVVQAVEHALTARRPKARYLVGREARAMALLARLPDRWRDWLILNRMRA